MPLHNVSPRDIPTNEDAEYYRTERNAYTYRAPNNEHEGWGIPPHRMAPEDALDYVIAKYREDDLDLYHHDPRDRERYQPIHPRFTWSIALATMAHFAWFKTQPGAHYINRFYGVQEVPPFFDGYVYLWVDPKSPEQNPIELKPGQLRIFRQWERVVEPACPGAFKVRGERPFIQMARLIEQYRSPFAPDIGPMESESDLEERHNEQVFNWVSEAIQQWLIEPKADGRWPYPKRTRISGPEWVREQKNADGTPFWGGLDKIIQYHNHAYRNRSPGPVRAYRIQGDNGGVRWCPNSEIRVIPRIDYHRVFRKDMTEPQIAQNFQCRACRHTRSCVPHTGKDHMCCHCYAKEVEQGTSMPTLNRCTMLPECKACPDRIDNNSNLVRLKQNWNRPSRTGPVPR